WNFGYGLSYTTFKYSDLKVEKEKVTEKEDVVVTVNVTNSGDVAGREVVDLYLGEEYREVTHPVRQLEGFDKILLQPGQTKEVKFVIRPERLSFAGINNRRIIQPGTFKVSVGNLYGTFEVVGPRIKYFPGRVK
ncbi:MAG TPA: fibronectin type III-like domain-contianing protein, partial [Candidatus Kryptobacter bacterium]